MIFFQKDYESNNAMDITVVKATIVFHISSGIIQALENSIMKQNDWKLWKKVSLLFNMPVIFKTFRIQLSE